MANLSTVGACAALITTLLIASGAQAVPPDAKCQAAKLKITGKYSFCRLKAQSKAVKGGSMTELPAALDKCEATFSNKWAAAETKGGGSCPTTGDAGTVESITGDFANFAVLSLDLVRFIDNSDGTISDTKTGLMWEKKQNRDSEVNYSDPHDADNTYTWSTSGGPPNGTAFTDFLGTLNNCTTSLGTDGFAGHCDWRLPTLAELKSIFFTYSNECPGGSVPAPCTDPIFFPTAFATSGLGPMYWTSISAAPNTALSWGFDFTSCTCPKSDAQWVRAVRSTLGPPALAE